MKSDSGPESTAARLVAPLHQFGRTSLEQAGGKGANLGELIRAGFPVPPGFVVTTAAYDRFVTHNALGTTITSILHQRENPGVAIRDSFRNSSIPPDVEQSILAAYQQLAAPAVAVRSSATAEDLPEAAFAGQQDTYLNITGADALLKAVQRCWASLWTDRAIAYRERLGLDQQTVRIAVVVQRMVVADAAGVLFTANTVTGARDETVIDATAGLGEAIVSGLVTPDHFRLRRRRWGWRILERRRGRREAIIRARSGGGVEHVRGEGVAEGAVLPDRALRHLADLGAAIQRLFEGPQDIEWAWAGGRPFILQARPITALPEPPPRANRLVRLLASNFGEMLPVRPYPLDVATWIPALSGAVEPMFRLLGLSWTLEQMFEVEDGVVIRFNGRLPRPTWRVLLAPARLVAHVLRYDPVQWRADPLLAETLARTRALNARNPGALSWAQLLAAVHGALEIPSLPGELRRRYFPSAAFALLRLRLFLTLAGRANQLGMLLSGAESMTLEANHALEALATRVRSDPELARLFAAHEPRELGSVLAQQPAGRRLLIELRRFLDHYGHRETIISTALEPTWKDAPEVVLGLIRSFVAHPPPPDPEHPAWQVARDELVNHPLLHPAPLRAAFLKTLKQARVLLPFREDTHFYATLPLPWLRQALLEFGSRLASAGILESPEDVFHLRLDELERIRDMVPPPPDLADALRAAVRRRKQARARLADTPLVDPRLFPQRPPTGDAMLQGIPGSPGMVEGPARIVHDSSEFDRLLVGEVLVAPYTNPSWTPLFQRAIAVVVDSGSPASHAAIVAREYGIPAVMSTVTGTRTLRDGDLIRVDGSLGLVFSVAPGDGAE